jgi:hypothetical protein
MGPPGPPEKKQKRLSPLETKLQTLQRTLAGLQPIWMKFDPGIFMAQMRHIREQIDEVTPDAIGDFFATETDTLLDALGFLDGELLGETPSMGSPPLTKTDSYQKTRKLMSDYVGRVRGSLEGQSQARILPRC